MSTSAFARRTVAALVLVCITSGASSLAADCTGDPGFMLGISPSQVPIGSAFQVSVEAPAGSLVLLLMSGQPGPTQTPFGELCVSLPAGIFPFVTPSSSLTFPHFVACEPAFVGLTGYFQFLAADPNQPGQVFRSNSQSLVIVDGQCTAVPDSGDFASFTQGGWGQECSGGNVGCLRDAHFDAVYPNGLVLGDPDGADGDSEWAIVLTSSAAVAAFMPTGSTPSPLAQNHVDPVTTEAGVFAGQLAAAKLNVAFDAAGAFDSLKSNQGVLLGDLVFIANVHPALIGKTVLEVIQLSDAVISG
ncbi:MAG: hypothetical protein ACF8XB_00440, partial [Planctomycetota bacterium JB042]